MFWQMSLQSVSSDLALTLVKAQHGWVWYKWLMGMERNFLGGLMTPALVFLSLRIWWCTILSVSYETCHLWHVNDWTYYASSFPENYCIMMNDLFMPLLNNAMSCQFLFFFWVTLWETACSHCVSLQTCLVGVTLDFDTLVCYCVGWDLAVTFTGTTGTCCSGYGLGVGCHTDNESTLLLWGSRYFNTVRFIGKWRKKKKHFPV